VNDLLAASAPVRRRPHVVRVLAGAIWSFRGRATLAALLLIGSRLAFVGTPWLLKSIIDTLSRPQQVLVLPVFLLLGYALLRFGGGLLGELRDMAFAKVALASVADLTLQTFKQLLRLGPRFHMQKQTGALIRDVERGSRGIGFLLGVALFSIAPTLVEISVVLAILLKAYSVVFGLIIATTFAVYAGVTGVLSGRRAALQREVNRLDGGVSGRLVDSLMNYEAVKACANESFESRRVDAAMQQRDEVALRNQGALSLLHITQSAVIACGVAAVMLYAGQLVVRGGLSIGDLVLINSYVIQVCMPLNTLGFVFREARDALIDVDRMLQLFEQKPDIEETATPPALQLSAGEVRFEKVDFSYDSGHHILWDIDFRIAPGGTVAVVGGSGSGKSTLVRLLLRFYEPSAGRILIDGQDIRSVSTESLRQAIGIVPQDTILFNDTVAYNIAYGRPGASMADIVEAAKAAHVHDFVATLPEQYETRVGERGLRLSGGEKQRISIARAILRNPAIMIFDEATSALDTRSERAIQQEIDRISRNRTALVIAHRLSTVVDADEILVLERGRHEELLQIQGVYAQLWALQRQQNALEQTEHRSSLQPLDLGKLTAAVIDGLRPLIESKHLDLHASLHADGAQITADPRQLQDVVRDLLTHAVDVSAPGSALEIQVERTGPVARIAIADTPSANSEESVYGTLLPAEPPPDPLRIRSIVEQNNGHFDFAPSGGGGSDRYIIEFPLRALTPPAVKSGEQPARLLQGLALAVVDDDPAVREVLAEVLEGDGAQVVAYADGHSLLSQLEATPGEQWPDALICDLSLGDDDGHRVIQAVRALEARRAVRHEARLPAIALSGYAGVEDRTRALLAGFQAHLGKPADARELAATVRALLADRGARDGGTRARETGGAAAGSGFARRGAFGAERGG
jgi:ATP-binding cassette subfamily B protein